MDTIKIFAPATVANVSCGFDIMGFALDNLGDEMLFTKTKSKKIVITKIEGANLPFDPKENVVGVVAQKMLKDSQADFGLKIEIYKNFKPGSGLGSSAASASGTAYAVNELLAQKFTQTELVKYAMLGEVVACGAAIADNVAAAIFGGFVLIRSYKPLHIITIPTPKELMVTVIHPQIEIKTADSRDVLPKKIDLKTGISQWANVGGLISGLHTSDYDLIGKSMVDYVAEPARKHLIPFFDEIKELVLNQGAIGVGISGSGPSIFALSKGKDTAIKVKEAMDSIYKNTDIKYNIYVSKIGIKGSRIIK